MFEYRKNSSDEELNKFKEEIEKILSYGFDVFGDMFLVSPIIDKRFVKIKTKSNRLSWKFVLYQMLIIKYALENNPSLLYDRKGELFHESIVYFLEKYKDPRIQIKMIRGLRDMKELARTLVNLLTKMKSKTYYKKDPEPLKKLLYERYVLTHDKEPLCPICMKPLKYEEVEIGYIVPYEQVRVTSISNIVLVHRDCKLIKENKLQEIFTT